MTRHTNMKACRGTAIAVAVLGFLALAPALAEAQAPSTYTVSGSLNTVRVDVTSSIRKIQDVLTFTKASDDSHVEVYLNSRLFSGVFEGGALGLLVEVRIDNRTTAIANRASITQSNDIQFVSILAAFQGLPAGTHTVSLWGRTSGGSSTGVLLDPGGFGGRVIVKETF